MNRQDPPLHKPDECSGAQLKALWESSPDELEGSRMAWNEWAEAGWRYEPKTQTWSAAGVDDPHIRGNGNYCAITSETPQAFTPIDGPLSEQPEGLYKYVVRTDDTLVIVPAAGNGHWNLALGEDVKAAGEIDTRFGGFALTNNSGHYRPTGPAQQRAAIIALSELATNDPGIDFSPGLYDEQPFPAWDVMRSHRHCDPVVLPDGITVWGAAFPTDGYERNEPPDFGLYLDPLWKPPWSHAHVPWEDFGLPGDIDALREALVVVRRRAKSERVEIGCLGGHGRAGTTLACLAVMAGLSEDPVRWIRARYCHLAIETDEQVAFAREFTRHSN